MNYKEGIQDIEKMLHEENNTWVYEGSLNPVKEALDVLEIIEIYGLSKFHIEMIKECEDYKEYQERWNSIVFSRNDEFKYEIVFKENDFSKIKKVLGGN